ncbi:PE-PPE domain-containing protein [Mycobacterium sp. M1]|uniref:PE-PPE domain-containing protein n=1 Tax=Mycolicibacter acidiphilus TaxID=2835306 RepID=A0ABS5RIG5_9MYCO|nr:PE-PPE domain-containing protein [Mycolicibacter acidiphilus]MBS9534093.1 PE-PPE domain-containing protein [Mycolicibacter acidiphilus]
MVHVLRTGTGIVVAAAGLAVAPLPSAPPSNARTAILTAADAPLGGGVALVLGPSGIPIPPQSYIDMVDQLYLAPRGFTGVTQGVNTPEGLYPITGVHSLLNDTSNAQGVQILEHAIMAQIAGGHVDAVNPVVVFGWSQSSVISTMVMPDLAKLGVPTDDVHFVLVGDEAIPNGGVLSMFDVPAGAHPSAPSLGITFTGPQPNDLYPTDVYTNEYDGFADFPRYPLNELSTINALLGIVFQHLLYPALTPEQIADAHQLVTSAADTLTNYYVVPDPYLPLLEPLLLFGPGGKVLYDLLEPDMRILVDLGYGSLTEGWNQGPADVATQAGLWPTNIDPGQLLTALANGAQQGITDAVHDLQDPTATQTALTDALAPLVSAAHTMGFTTATDPTQLLTNLPELLALARNFLGAGFANFPISDATPSSSLADIVNAITGTLSGDYATLLPLGDTGTALLSSLPNAAVTLLTDSFQSGDILGGLEQGIGALAGLIPFAVMDGVIAPVAEALGGTVVNLADLLGLGGDLSD